MILWSMSLFQLVVSVILSGLLFQPAKAKLECYYCNDCTRDGHRKINCADKYSIPNEDYRDRERVRLSCFKRGNSKGCLLVSRETDLRCYDSYEHEHGRRSSGMPSTRHVLDTKSPENWYEPLDDVFCLCDDDKCNDGSKPRASITNLVGVTLTFAAVQAWLQWS